MKKQGVPARSGRSEVGPAPLSEDRSNAKAPSATPAVPILDLAGFDLTDFARFLRETDPEWINGTTKSLSSTSFHKR